MQRVAAKWHNAFSRTLVLQSPDEPLHHRDASVFADGAVSRRLDALSFDPASECLAIENAVPVADDVFGRGALVNRPSQERADGPAIWPVAEDTDVHDAARVMVDDNSDPPTKGPALGNRLGKPRGTKTRASRHGREVNVPDVVGSFPRDHATCGFGFR